MNGLNKSSGTASSNISMICPTKTLLVPSVEITGKNTAHEHIAAPIISNMLKMNRRRTLKPMSLSVAMSSIMQILDTTEINIVGIVTPTISSIRFFKIGVVKSVTMKSCTNCGSCPTTNDAANASRIAIVMLPPGILIGLRSLVENMRISL